MKYIKQRIESIVYLIDDIIHLEEDQGTFPDEVLDDWIDMLKHGSLKCPCQRFGYEVSENCLFYDYQDCCSCNVCEDCDEEEECDFDNDPAECQYFCDECYGYAECGDCERSDLWNSLIHKTDGFEMPSKLVEWFIANIIAKRLEEL